MTAGAASGAGRLLWLDLGRTLALLAMIVFHATRDLELFGLVPSGYTMTGGWPLFARLIAGSFLFLSGVSLIVAHGAGLRPKPWAKRFAVVVLAASAVSAATYAAFPARFVYFGILHAIAACSLIGVLLLRVPGWGLAILATAVLLSEGLLGGQVFATPWLAWTGLSAVTRPSLDLVPLVPWLAAFLGGMAFARLVPVARLDPAALSGRWVSWVAWPGQHSLAVYLGHQPVLLTLIWVATRWAAP
ncbi:heparan-alpha-glucosaminide N-acetyltransferase [Cognatishimia sp. F0-27]|uniref:heparan-alpha-glucosaminide N-acetyltransferase n=1 Tax=Cognatishimia sp. F0-27 TaxID=2816855 RepID=UPI001D0C8B78|nr:heparan-alpha-glucosaminide N-acetyltransferase [Cognatishimia sp. F0-27]MCC1494518.1 DUF1624 domain-containing protein [Cognatishimia sp. F0-27]